MVNFTAACHRVIVHVDTSIDMDFGHGGLCTQVLGA